MNASQDFSLPLNRQGVSAISSDARWLLRSLNGSLPEPVLHPVLVVVSGLPGTGKSYFSRRLAEKVPLAVLESDALRKVLVASPRHTGKENARLFQAIHAVIDLSLEKGIPVLLDATSLAEAHREPLYRLAERHHAKLMVVVVGAPPEVVRRRLEERQRSSVRQDHSDADWEVYHRLRPLQEPVRRNHIRVDTSEDIGPPLERIAREIRGWIGRPASLKSIGPMGK